MFMENPADINPHPVIAAAEQARDALLAALGGVSFGLLSDDDSLSMLLTLESVGRVVDGARLLSTTDVLHRSEYLGATVPKSAVINSAGQNRLVRRRKPEQVCLAATVS